MPLIALLILLATVVVALIVAERLWPAASGARRLLKRYRRSSEGL